MNFDPLTGTYYQNQNIVTPPLIFQPNFIMNPIMPNTFVNPINPSFNTVYPIHHMHPILPMQPIQVIQPMQPYFNPFNF